MNSPLHLKVFSEVSACIGCNDCLLACPIPESREVTIAELNRAVRSPVVEAPNVARFVTACTQCQRCVPACPADLSRADMVLVNKMKVEDSVADHILPLTAGGLVGPSPWTLDGLTAELAQLELFAGVPKQDIRRLVLTATLRDLPAGTELCRAGDYYERLMVVLAGKLIQYVEQHPGAHLKVGSDRQGEPWDNNEMIRVPLVGFESGAFLGEAAMMAEQPEPFGIVAQDDCLLLELPRAAVRRLLDASVSFRQTMEDLHRKRVLFNSQNVPSLSGAAPPVVYRALMAQAELLVLRDRDTVFSEKASLEAVYVVRSGFVRLYRLLPGGPRVLTYLTEGSLLGAQGAVYRERSHAYGAEAAGRLEVFRVDIRDVYQAMMDHPTLGQALLEAAADEDIARSGDLSPTPDPGAAGGPTHLAPLHRDALADAGLLRAREVLVVDQTRCTNCEACVEACARRHGHGRLQLRGLQMEHLLFPTACRHCEDPVCLLCSVSGIVRRASGEISVIDDNCVGCGACATRCPYGNITMGPESTAFENEPFDLWTFLGLRKKRHGHAVASSTGLMKAHKCDLCADYADYACVNACPTGAAFRTDLGELVVRKDGETARRLGSRD